ncbi:hypothetical protein GYMLUDRAFT_820992 [Collybiopsis luxurians FD-317 M1]|uniref:C2H2-type domain-containing protein n=1 Tax=Collybiopsis luxurians FD-317 M1 TaxID=944289 RepID=A0A0D0C2C4_9AGAR|nr:hypothetical protein GYMLUDRAFT_820992 [Collybiopsis luxurians FD-317 M1]
MPKVLASNTETSRDPTVCEVCGTRVARKGDIPRHMQSHLSAEEKASISYSCPYADCSYKSLQKVNVDTHIRKHTKVKDQQCPTCNFATGDPGSLTRHRKRRHEYVPKPRKPRTPGNSPPDATPAQIPGEIVIETPADYESQTSSPSVETSPSEAPSPSQSTLALDTGYESDATQLTSTSAYSATTQLSTASVPPVNLPLLFVNEGSSYMPSRPSGRRLGLADILSDDVYWH